MPWLFFFLNCFFFTFRKEKKKKLNEEKKAERQREQAFDPTVSLSEMAGIPLELLDDLCTRFLLNVPAHELE